MDDDTEELGGYFAGKSSFAVNEDLEHLEKLIERAKRVADTLGDNGRLAWRCAIDRCLSRGSDPEVDLCRACTAHATALRLVEQLQALEVERREAASLAKEIQSRRYH